MFRSWGQVFEGRKGISWLVGSWNVGMLECWKGKTYLEIFNAKINCPVIDEHGQMNKEVRTLSI